MLFQVSSISIKSGFMKFKDFWKLPQLMSNNQKKFLNKVNSIFKGDKCQPESVFGERLL